jgi:ABC-type nitrate/sulfonate/bicarbonate transport system substrate-binding protein
MKFLIPTRVLGCLALAGAMMASSAPGASAQSAALTPITMAVSSTTLAYGGLRIAQQAGLFQKNGLDPKVIVMDSGNAAITAVLAGSAEFSAAGPGEVLAAKVRGQNMVILANMYRGLSGSLVLSKATAAKLALPANASVEQKLKVLNGLTIASPSATSAYTHPVKSAAEAVKANIKFIYMAQPAMVAALRVGAVQGMIAGAPFSLMPISDGSGVLWLSGPKGDLPPSVLPASSACLQTSETYAKAHPKIIKEIHKVFADLSQVIKQHPEQAKAMLGKGYPDLDPAALAAIFEEDGQNWAQPVMTEADIRQEIAIQMSSGSLQNADQVAPASILLMPER